jgi:hypothetical protein
VEDAHTKGTKSVLRVITLIRGGVCSMKLTLHEQGRFINRGVFGTGDGCSYSVSGLPVGENATIAEFNGAWRILRWNDTWHGNWEGEYASRDAAVAALQEEVILTFVIPHEES